MTVPFSGSEIGKPIGKYCMLVHRLFLLALLGGEILYLVTFQNSFNAFQNSLHSPVDESFPSYDNLEYLLSDIFNDLYFRAVHEHGNYPLILMKQKPERIWGIIWLDYSSYADLWRWVDHYCPSGISDYSCLGGASYSITMCQADYSSCYASQRGDSSNFACPYNDCRSGVWTYALTYSK